MSLHIRAARHLAICPSRSMKGLRLNAWLVSAGALSLFAAAADERPLLCVIDGRATGSTRHPLRL